MTENKHNLNKGIEIEPLEKFKQKVIADGRIADREPFMEGKWIGGDASSINFGGLELQIGGEGKLNPMQMLLASFIACDIDVLAMHSSFLGLKIEELTIEASGKFNVQSYIGAADEPGSGYNNIDYTVRIKAPSITPEQQEYLIERCDISSPVGDTLTRPVQLNLEFVVE